MGIASVASSAVSTCRAWWLQLLLVSVSLVLLSLAWEYCREDGPLRAPWFDKHPSPHMLRLLASVQPECAVPMLQQELEGHLVFDIGYGRTFNQLIAAVRAVSLASSLGACAVLPGLELRPAGPLMPLSHHLHMSRVGVGCWKEWHTWAPSAGCRRPPPP